jgi:hypothetical protein
MLLRTSVVALLLLCSAGAWGQPRLVLDDQDNRIVLVGNGFIEQERLSGYLEARLMRHGLNHSTTCRNLGWSGDSVTGDARPSGFQNPAGVNRLMKDAKELKPTIIFVGYGFVESFDGDAGLPRFKEGYEALLDRLGELTPTLVLLSPTIQEGDPQRNGDLERYTAAISEIAAKRKLPFVDLFHALSDFKSKHPDIRLTSNGITLNDCGYWLVGQATERQLKLEDRVESSFGPTNKGEIKIQIGELSLPVSASPCPDLTNEAGCPVIVPNLAPGQWTLMHFGNEIATADAAKWAAGVTVQLESDQELAEQFRQAIIESGALFYRRSRPFNDHPRHFTYIDKDYPLYDAELAEQDKVIARLRKPVEHEFELVKKEAAKP